MRTISRQRIDNRDERQVLTGMIVSSTFLRRVRPIIHLSLFVSPHSRILAKWCTDYFDKYEKAPGRHIQDIYASAKRKNLQPDQAVLISDFLESISGEYRRKKLNVTYLLDLTEERFKARSLEILKEDLEENLLNGNVQEAEAALSRFKKVQRVSVDGINPFTNKEAIIDAFETDITPLYTLPGDLGKIMNQELVRGNFIGIMAPEKRGKSFWAQELCFRAYKSRRNVAHFVVGDMSLKQMMRRIHVRLTGRHYLKRYCGAFPYPVVDCRLNQKNACTRKERGNRIGLDNAKSLKDVPDGYRTCTRCRKKAFSKFRGATWYVMRNAVKPLTWTEAFKAGNRLATVIGSKKSYKLVVTPNLTVAGIISQLDIWQDQLGWMPDMIVIDYADVMDPEPGSNQKDERHQQNERWRKLRQISLERNCLVVTFTQTDADSYDRDLIGSKNFSEDKRKYGHVTGMGALNQTDEEKDAGELRFGWVFLREGAFDRRKTVTVLECRPAGNVMVASYRSQPKGK